MLKSDSFKLDAAAAIRSLVRTSSASEFGLLGHKLFSDELVPSNHTNHNAREHAGEETKHNSKRGGHIHDSMLRSPMLLCILHASSLPLLATVPPPRHVHAASLGLHVNAGLPRFTERITNPRKGLQWPRLIQLWIWRFAYDSTSPERKASSAARLACSLV